MKKEIERVSFTVGVVLRGGVLEGIMWGLEDCLILLEFILGLCR